MYGCRCGCLTPQAVSHNAQLEHADQVIMDQMCRIHLEGDI